MWGPGQGVAALRHAAKLADVSPATLKRWGEWLDADTRPDTAQARAVGEVIRSRRSIPRGADPRS